MIDIDIVEKSRKWQKIDKINNFIEKTCKKLIKLSEIGKVLQENNNLELSLSLVSDVQMRKINHEFRKKDKTTNILSFPAIDPKLIKKDGLKDTINSCNYVFLGDIIISFDRVDKESLAQSKKFHDHLTHLILHSILHLIGYDHENEQDAKIMENMEIEILKKLKISNPYVINN